MSFNPFSHCRKQYGVSIWQCPGFLFFVMGIVNIASIFATYFVAQKYTEPETVILIVMGVSAFIFVISQIITGTFAKLAETNKMKTEFLSVVSHQLLTPLSSEKWLLNMLIGQKIGPVNPEQKEYLELLKSNSDKAIKLINDLLNISRIEEERMMFDKKPFNISEAIKEVFSEQTPTAHAAKISLQLTDETDGKIMAIGDEEKVKIVIENFIGNAIKYTKENGQIVVILRKEDDNIKLSVADNGVGIPENEKSLIFQKFFRSGNAKRYQTMGSGIGLYISKYMIEKLGGKIGFESEEEKGSVFWFTLPIKS